MKSLNKCISIKRNGFKCSFKATNNQFYCGVHKKALTVKGDSENCPICLTLFTEVHRVILCCGHNVCKLCRLNIITCPYCKVLLKTKLSKEDKDCITIQIDLMILTQCRLKHLEEIMNILNYAQCPSLNNDNLILDECIRKNQILLNLCDKDFKRFYQQSRERLKTNNDEIDDIKYHIAYHEGEIFNDNDIMQLITNITT